MGENRTKKGHRRTIPERIKSEKGEFVITAKSGDTWPRTAHCHRNRRRRSRKGREMQNDKPPTLIRETTHQQSRHERQPQSTQTVTRIRNNHPEVAEEGGVDSRAPQIEEVEAEGGQHMSNTRRRMRSVRIVDSKITSLKNARHYMRNSDHHAEKK